MQKKFECLNCHCQFEADNLSMVKCPKCGSDNVDLSHFHLPKSWWKWALMILILGCVILVLIYTNRSEQKENSIATDREEIADTIADSLVDTMYVDDNPPSFVKTPRISVKGPSYIDGSYKLSFKVTDAPTQKYYVSLIDHNGTKEIARSEDGEHFTKIPASDNEGIYDVAVFLASNDSMLCAPLPVAGFKSLEVVKEKMTKERLQTLLGDLNANLTGAQNWISADCKLHFTGLSSTDNLPSTLSEVQTQVDLLWSEAVITDLKYDNKNRVTDIYINVQK